MQVNKHTQTPIVMATIYKKINPIQLDDNDSPLDELKIRVEYNKGGYNSKRGVYAYINPVHREVSEYGCRWEKSVPLGFTQICGFRMLLRELGRKSQKTEDELSAKVLEKADEMAKLWDEEKFEDVIKILRSV